MSGLRPQGGQRVGDQIVPNGYEADASGRVNSLAAGSGRPQGGKRVGDQIVPNGYEVGASGRVEPMANLPPKVDSGRFGGGSGKGGIGGSKYPIGGRPAQGGYAPLSPQGSFNVNQAAAGGLRQAMQGTQQAMGFQPQQVGAAGYNPAQIAGQDLSAYTNPYEDQVVQQSLGDLERSRQMQQNVGGAQASSAGAFGGSRHGIAEAETNRAFADQAARTASGLRQGGYANAQGLAGQDVGFMNQAAQYNTGAQNAAMMANQQAGTQANQQRLAASGQMGQLGNQAFNTGQTIQQGQMQQGLMQQGLQQALIDAARGQYAGYTGSPGASLNAPLAALGVAGPNSGSTTTQTSNPGLFDYLGLGFGLGAR